MVSDGLVIVLCIVAAGFVVTAAAAMYRSGRTPTEERTSNLVTPNESQYQYMRKVRLKNWATFREVERNVHSPTTMMTGMTGTNTMMGSRVEV
jgi:hypothetical protein